MTLRLRPKSERERSAAEVARDLAPRLAQVPGMRAFIQVPPSIRLGGILYESTIHPLTILSALPFAGFGALLSLLLFGFELDYFRDARCEGTFSTIDVPVE